MNITSDSRPRRRQRSGYEVPVFEQPGFVNGNQDAQVTAVAYCAPIATGHAVGSPDKATVFGSGLASK